MARVSINGLPLPEHLVQAIEDGRWSRAVESAVLHRVFGDKPVDPRRYNQKDMHRENGPWALETDPLYLGQPSDEHPPGDLDPNRSILIGDLGPDMPFALDYRGGEHPTVVYLDLEGRWRKVADDIEQLMSALGLLPKPN